MFLELVHKIDKIQWRKLSNKLCVIMSDVKHRQEEKQNMFEVQIVGLCSCLYASAQDDIK